MCDMGGGVKDIGGRNQHPRHVQETILHAELPYFVSCKYKMFPISISSPMNLMGVECIESL